MGSGNWFRAIIRRKKGKAGKSNIAKQEQAASEKSNGSRWRHHHAGKDCRNVEDDSSNKDVATIPIEHIAALRIQKAFRSYKARKALRSLKGAVRFQALIQGPAVKKQASSALDYIHSWSRIQSEIRARRICMVTEGRIRQKKLENQLKLEAKIQELEVEWCGGSETMEEILSRIQQREEAAVKRERAMAYAFSHQWRANSSQYFGQAYYDLGKESWGWSWMERWIAVRPWETRVSTESILPKTRPVNKTGKTSKQAPMKILVSVKPTFPNGKGTRKARKLSPLSSSQSETDETKAKQE